MNMFTRLPVVAALVVVAGLAHAGGITVPQAVGNTGGTLTLTLDNIEAGVNWTATENSDWLNIASGASGVGPGAIAIDYLANPASVQRVATVTIETSAGQTTFVEVTQAPTGPWTLTIGDGIALTAPTMDGTYENNAVVEIEARPGPGKQFVRWIGGTSTVADVNDPTTTVTMLSNVSLAAEAEYAVPQLTGITPGSGPDTGGTQVSLQGVNLTEASEVLFGGVAALNVQVAADNVVLCRAPAHAAATVQVTVETPGGVSNGVGYVFTATTPAAPVLSQISPASGPAAGGTLVTLVGSNLAGATAVNFGGTAAAGLNVSGTNLVTCISPQHAGGSVQVTLTTAGGTSNGLSYTFEGGDSGGCGGGKKSFEEMLGQLVLGLLVVVGLLWGRMA